VRVLVTGVSGQDGAWLARQLLAEGHEVWGTYRRSADRTFGRLHALGIADDVRYVLVDLCEATNLLRAVDKVQPDEVYHLAAQSFVADSFELPVYTLDVDATGTARLLEAVRTAAPGARFYQASTSELFGAAGAGDVLLDEGSPFRPRSPYAVAKLAAHELVGLYRDAHGLHACRGLLFNHESELRGPEFVTRKVTLGVADVVRGRRDALVLGNVEARRDWGYAPDFVDAMVRMLRHPTPDDYVVATGRSASVRDFVTLAFAAAGLALAWEGEGADTVARDAAGTVRVRVDPALWRPADVGCLRGDASKARRVLGWSPTTSLEQLVERMVAHDLGGAVSP
jgi:GDPmannose 4,6-dehydratase